MEEEEGEEEEEKKWGFLDSSGIAGRIWRRRDGGFWTVLELQGRYGGGGGGGGMGVSGPFWNCMEEEVEEERGWEFLDSFGIAGKRRRRRWRRRNGGFWTVLELLRGGGRGGRGGGGRGGGGMGVSGPF
ncbi:hypothetical protein ACOMHN_032801 [Nucella lapillus]